MSKEIVDNKETAKEAAKEVAKSFLYQTNLLPLQEVNKYIFGNFIEFTIDEKTAVVDYYFLHPGMYRNVERVFDVLYRSYFYSIILNNDAEEYLSNKDFDDLKLIHDFMTYYNKKEEAAKVYKKMEEYVINNPVKSYK